jgi:hypothetical protein
MNGIKKILALMNFKDSNDLTSNEKLFQSELKYFTDKTGVSPTEAIFISYAYNGPDYNAYFMQASNIFAKSGIKLIDIKKGDPAALINAAQMIVVGGGDIMKLVNALNSLKASGFDPYLAIRKRIEAAIPYLGWNEGSSIVSTRYFYPPSTLMQEGIGGSPFQIITNFQNTNSLCRPAVETYLKNNSLIKLVIAMTDALNPDGKSTRLEESGAGMIDTISAPYPAIIKFELKDGKLSER